MTFTFICRICFPLFLVCWGCGSETAWLVDGIAGEGSHAPNSVPEKSSNSTRHRKASMLPNVISKIKLEDVSFYVRGRWQPDTFVKFSPDGSLLGIGTHTGRMRMWDVHNNEMLWDKSIAEGVVKRIDFSPDGKTVYFGEQSVDGFIYGAMTRTGDTLWRFRLADDLQTSAPPAKDDSYGIFRLPGPYGIKTLENGDVIVLGIHAWDETGSAQDMTRLSRIYRLSPKGVVRWAYPADSPLPMTIIYLDVDKNGERVAFLVTKKGTQKSLRTPFQEGTMVVLNGKSGTLYWQHSFKPLAPWFDSVGFWESISVSPDGTRASVGLFDGRTMLFDLDRRQLEKVFEFGAPISISGVPVSASATYNHLASDGMAYFQTGTSTVPFASNMAHVVAPPGPHPNATMLTAVNPDGKVAWRYRSGHSFQNFWTSDDGRWVLTSVLRDDEILGWESGAMLFDSHRSGGGTARLVYFYQVEGKTHFHADISKDGSVFALVETPYRDPKTQKIVGTYQVHVVR